MSRGPKIAVTAVMAAAILCLGAAMGVGGSSSAEGNDHRVSLGVSAPLLREEFLPRPEGIPQPSPGGPECRRAVATAHRGAGLIDVVLHCAARRHHAGLAIFDISREDGQGKRTYGIYALRRPLKVDGAGGNGECRREGGLIEVGSYEELPLACWVKVRGRVRVRARLQVLATTVCTMRVLVSGVDTAGYLTLLNHKPGGC
jgi:hypothetical protein